MDPVHQACVEALKSFDVAAMSRILSSLSPDLKSPTLAYLQDLGNTAYKSGAFEMALSHYHQCLLVDKQNGHVWSNIAVTLSKLGRFDEALLAARQCVACNPSWVKGHYRLGCVLMQLKLVEDALATFQTALDIDPNNTEVRQKLTDASSILKQREAISAMMQGQPARGTIVRVDVPAPKFSVSKIQSTHEQYFSRAANIVKLDTSVSSEALLAYLRAVHTLLSLRLDIERWSTLLCDGSYVTALQNLLHVNAGAKVLHVGAGIGGSPILSLVSGASSVTCIENRKFHLTVLAATALRNLSQDELKRLTMLPKAVNVIMQTDLDPMDIVVLENIDDGLLGSRVVPSILHLRHIGAITANTLFFPSKATVIAQLIDMSTPAVLGIDVGDVDACRWAPHYELLNSQQYESMSDFFTVCDMDFATITAASFQSKLYTLRVKKSGRINAVVFWNVLYHENKVLLDFAVSKRQVYQYLDQLQVEENSSISIAVNRNATRVWFQHRPAPVPVLRQQILPVWQFDMLCDQTRNKCYSDAILSAVSSFSGTETRVLDIGSGTGVLSAFARAAGATYVTGCEQNPHLVEVSKEILRKHGIRIGRNRDKVNLVATDVRELKTDQKYNVLVTELFDDGGVGEGIIPLILHAKKHLLSEGATIIPSRMKIFAVLIQHSLPKMASLDLGSLNLYRWQPEYSRIDINSNPHISILSEHMELFHFDFNDDTTLQSLIKPVEFMVTHDGITNAVVFYFSADLDDLRSVSSSPFVGHKSHWQQAVRYIPNVAVKKGQQVRILAGHNTSDIHFDLEGPAMNNDPNWTKMHLEVKKMGAQVRVFTRTFYYCLFIAVIL